MVNSELSIARTVLLQASSFICMKLIKELSKSNKMAFMVDMLPIN